MLSLLVYDIEQLDKIYAFYIEFQGMLELCMSVYVYILCIYYVYVCLFDICIVYVIDCDYIEYTYISFPVCILIYIILYTLSYTLYIYIEFQDSQSTTLWNDLNILTLQTNITTFINKLKKFPSEIKEIYTYKKIEYIIYNFKDSLPLIINLKNECMKQRHWLKLINITNNNSTTTTSAKSTTANSTNTTTNTNNSTSTFDITLKSVTLYNIFSMELYKYNIQIEEIINEAVQEAKIEG